MQVYVLKYYDSIDNDSHILAIFNAKPSANLLKKEIESNQSILEVDFLDDYESLEKDNYAGMFSIKKIKIINIK